MNEPRSIISGIQVAIVTVLVLAFCCVLSPPASAQTFGDVPNDYWAFSFIETLGASGITAGCGSGNYCPAEPVTRAQMAVFLERGIHGSNYAPPAATGTVFEDVGAGEFAASFIEQLFDDGITTGCGNNNYCPDSVVSRAQMAVFLLRAKYGAGYSPPLATGMFNDVPLNYWAVHWIEQLAAEGITAGCGGDEYCPDSDVNRDQMAVFLVRTFELASNQKTIGPAGGIFEFPNGITFDVPAGAVTEPVSVELTLTDCGPLEPILNDRAFSTKPDKRCVAAFAGKPSGFEFNSPVLVRLPIAPLASGTVPILADIDRILGTYQQLPTVIDYDGVAGIVQLELNSFSEKALGSYEMDPVTEFGHDWATGGNDIETMCGSCEAQGTNRDFCQDLDDFEDACCLLHPDLRTGCFGTCTCCKELAAEIVVTGVDFSSGECQLLGSNLEVTYPLCDGAPTYTDSIGEASEECGDDTVWQITVEPPNAEIRACETQKFTAKIEGRSPGGVVFEAAPLPAFWESRDKSIARFIDGDGTLKGLKKDSTVVEARLSVDNPIDAVGEAPVIVTSNFDSFTVDPTSALLKVDETVLLEAQAVAATGVSPPPDPNETNWNSSRSSVADLTPAGSLATVVGVDKGHSTITASLDYLCETVESTASITVGCKEVAFTVSEPLLYLAIDETHPLSASAIDESDGTVLDTSGVTWQSGFTSVVGVGNAVGSQTEVRAIQPTVLGPVPVTATYDDGCQEKDAVTMVTVSCLNLELSVEEGAVAIGASLPITLTVLDDRGDPADIDESKIQWHTSDSDIGAVSPTAGAAQVNLFGISPGTVTVWAEYDSGPCGTVRTDPPATIKVGNTIAGLWHLSTVTQSEQCRYTGQDWWDEGGFAGFDVNVEQPVTEDGSVITATYVPDVGLQLSGNWDWNTGVFDLATNTSNAAECGYQFFWDDGADLCGDAVDCEFESCQNTTSLEGLTLAAEDGSISSLDADTDWYMAVTFSYARSAGLPRGTTTWECQGNATLSGSR